MLGSIERNFFLKNVHTWNKISFELSNQLQLNIPPVSVFGSATLKSLGNTVTVKRILCRTGDLRKLKTLKTFFTFSISTDHQLARVSRVHCFRDGRLVVVDRKKLGWCDPSKVKKAVFCRRHVSQRKKKDSNNMG